MEMHNVQASEPASHAGKTCETLETCKANGNMLDIQ